MVPTSEEAIQWLAYHQSQGHTMSNNETVLIAISFEGHNLIHHQSQKMVTSFQRGYSVQVLQIHAPFDYQMTNKEMNKMRVMHLQYNAIDKFDRYNWENGWIWLYGHTIHVKSMLTLTESSPPPYNLQDGFGAPWPIRPITIAT